MARYFFHLHETEAVVCDDEGMELGTSAEAIKVAAANARDIMVGELRSGRLNLSWSISIADKNATEVARVYFRDAVTVQT